MKSVLVAAAAVVLAAGVSPSVMAGAQQERMKTCNAEAKSKELKGAERKAFMKECLSTKKDEAATTKSPQQEKMKSCNTDAKAKGLSGDERKKFMSECLKG